MTFEFTPWNCLNMFGTKGQLVGKGLVVYCKFKTAFFFHICCIVITFGLTKMMPVDTVWKS